MKWIERRLKEIGKQKGGLAECLDISATRVSDLINGRRRLLAGEVIPLSDFLNLNISFVAALCYAQHMEEKSEKKAKSEKFTFVETK